MTRYLTEGPRPPIILEMFNVVFSAVALVLATVYMIQILSAPKGPYTPVSWSNSGYGALYYVPPGLTLIISVINFKIYRKHATPLLYALLFAIFMLAGWLTVVVWWIQCHLDLWKLNRYCYQRSLRFGEGSQTYRRVDNSIAFASIALGVLLLFMYIIYTISTSIEYYRNQRRRQWRNSSGLGDGYRRRNGGGIGGGGYYSAARFGIFAPRSAIRRRGRGGDGGGGGGSGGGDGGGGGGDGGDGGDGGGG
ncbi:hypothetical protein BU24DRAFT_472331 [Aaosphaeria arxii CBS 175.79]|uniref:MARVEL domain-containing protein n=1 Tax=Aaosphaeria arxii CBS 175.79 TaxID=1450172 RepID=A0A6A5XDT3_9PLEO|nr:uncharacterized protein BU24DRAFT_472331 [Aaosphaeria arxii CBS 175.79]KAF2011188.1 hypothetical protein BU24DRAFT_472331 [Aaosphaeria arxii CBS 175.79]